MPAPLNDADRIGWASSRLDEFIAAAKPVYVPSPPGVIGWGGWRTHGSHDEVVETWTVAERVLQRYLPDWRDRVQAEDAEKAERGHRWTQQLEGAQQCRVLLERQAEIDERLGEGGPSLDASAMHPWVWDAARSAWEAGNYEDAVDAASRNVSSRLRAKVGRRDLGEGDLVAQAFSTSPPDATSPRLRLPLGDDLQERTVGNVHGGVIAFGKGLYQAVRNPLAHEATTDVEMDEREALECLAAFSLLARWIDRATVHRQ